MHLSQNQHDALAHLSALNVNISELLLSLLGLRQEDHTILTLSVINDLALNYYTVLEAFRTHASFANRTTRWAHHYVIADVSEELNKLTEKKTGWHAYAKRAQVEQFEAIHTGTMATTAKHIAPRLWSLFEHLLVNSEDSHIDDGVVDDMISDAETLDGIQNDSVHMKKTERTLKLRELVCTCITYLKYISKINLHKSQ